MRYASKEIVLSVISQHPAGITATEVTKALWPDRTGCDYTASMDWTKKQIQTLRRKELVESAGMKGRSYLWRARL